MSLPLTERNKISQNMMGMINPPDLESFLETLNGTCHGAIGQVFYELDELYFTLGGDGDGIVHAIQTEAFQDKVSAIHEAFPKLNRIEAENIACWVYQTVKNVHVARFIMEERQRTALKRYRYASIIFFTTTAISVGFMLLQTL